MQHPDGYSTGDDGAPEIAAAQRRLVRLLAKAVTERLAGESRNAEATPSLKEGIAASRPTPS